MLSQHCATRLENGKPIWLIDSANAHQIACRRCMQMPFCILIGRCLLISQDVRRFEAQFPGPAQEDSSSQVTHALFWSHVWTCGGCSLCMIRKPTSEKTWPYLFHDAADICDGEETILLFCATCLAIRHGCWNLLLPSLLYLLQTRAVCSDCNS